MKRQCVPNLRCLSLLMLALSVDLRALVLAGEQRLEYVPDIDAWRVEYFAGSGNAGAPVQGPATDAGIAGCRSLCFFPDGQGFLAGSGVIFKISRGTAPLQEAVFRYFAGSPASPGYRDGMASSALLGHEISIAPDNKSGLYIGDRSNRCVRRVSLRENKWVIETIAGTPANPEWKDKPIDGIGAAAAFKYLHSNIIADEQGNAYIMDQNFLRRISPGGTVETLNLQGGSGPPPKGEAVPLGSARFNLIMGGGLCFGGDGNIYVADRWNHCIRMIDLKAQSVSVVVGPGTGYRDGPEKDCGFHDSPGYIVYDPYRKRFYTSGVDDWGLRVWENGSIKTIAGGNNKIRKFEGVARDAAISWGAVMAVDPLPPHDIYFRSLHEIWAERIGKLVQAVDKK